MKNPHIKVKSLALTPLFTKVERLALIPLLLLLFFSCMANAANKTYNWPADLASSPFNCSGFNCSGVDFGNDQVTINIHSNMTVNFSGNFQAKENLTFNNYPYTVNLSIGGSFLAENNFESNATLNLIAGRNIEIKNKLVYVGDMTAGKIRLLA